MNFQYPFLSRLLGKGDDLLKLAYTTEACWNIEGFHVWRALSIDADGGEGELLFTLVFSVRERL